MAIVTTSVANYRGMTNGTFLLSFYLAILRLYSWNKMSIITKPISVIDQCFVLESCSEFGLPRAQHTLKPLVQEKPNEPRREKTNVCICENKDADQLCGNR